MFLALKEARASDEQRRVILEAWDATNPRLETLERQTESLMEQWRGLDPRDGAYRTTAELLASKLSAVARERMVLSADFDGRVAAALDEDQWQSWQQYWQRRTMGPGERGPGPDGPGPGGPGRGRRPR
jgi:hypothetical protein